MGKTTSLRLGVAAALLATLPGGPAALHAQAGGEAAQAPEPPPTSARINLNITPKRLTFERGSRSASVYVFNQGNVPATVDVTLVERIMLPTGEIKTLDDALSSAETRPIAERLRSARGLVVAAPRRIVLAPGRGQTVRLRATPPGGGAGAEYRSHLTVATVPPRDAGLSAEDAAAQRPGELSFRFNAVFGLSIPIIIRTGTPDVRAEITNARLEEETISRDGIEPAHPTPIVAFELARLGSSSLFGNVEIRSATGSRELVGIARGVGVYPEIGSRRVRIPLRRAPAAGEVLDASFVDDDLTPGRVVAKASLAAF